MKASARIHSPARSSRRFLALSAAFLLGATAAILPTPPSEASFSLFSSPGENRDKQARGRVPGRRRGGARRGSCPDTPTPLTAIVAATNVETETLPETYVGGTTVADYPTFWFDVPYALTGDLTAEFVLQDEQGQDVYQTTSTDLAAGQTPGILGVPLSRKSAPLEVGKTYQWYFKVNCGSETPPYVQGGIERTTLAPNLASQLAAAPPLEQVALLQENELWYDAVTVLAPLYRTEPNDPSIQSAWTALLRSLDL